MMTRLRLQPIGTKVTKKTYAAGDKEKNQRGIIINHTHDGLIIVKWENGSIYNTHVGPDSLEYDNMCTLTSEQCHSPKYVTCSPCHTYQSAVIAGRGA